MVKVGQTIYIKSMIMLDYDTSQFQTVPVPMIPAQVTDLLRGPSDWYLGVFLYSDIKINDLPLHAPKSITLRTNVTYYLRKYDYIERIKLL